MWNGSNETIFNAPRNYMYGDKVFLLDSISSNNCAYLIGDLTNYVLSESPVQNKTLSFFINSPGGDAYTMMTIIGLINIAKLRNFEIHTFVMGCAGSAASLIAVQGDWRCMTNVSKHFVHFGCIVDVTQKHSEIDKIYTQNKEYAENIDNLYINACNGKFKKELLHEIQKDERGYLNAQDCLKYGLCDCIIEQDLDEKIFNDMIKSEYENGFAKFYSNKVKEVTKKTKSNKKTAKKSTKEKKSKK